MKTAVAAIAAAVLTFAAPDPQQVFRAGVNVVEVAVSVQEAGKPVIGLTAGDFIVRDRGAVQRVDEVVAEDVPLAVSLVPETQVGWPAMWPRIQDAVAAAAALLQPTDTFRILTVNKAVREVVPWSSGASKAALVLDADGASVLYDGLALALMEASGAIPRPVVITFTQAIDESSVTTLAHLTALARVSDAVCFAVVPIDRTKDRPQSLPLPAGLQSVVRERPKDYDGQKELREVTRLTAGEFFTVDGSEPLSAGFARAIDAVRGSYVLRFRPSDLATGWHDLDVRVNPGRYVVRARRGYMLATPRK